ncbi:MAG: discoidin domain-containing protein, partial [Planctomycetales bacterium]
RNDRRQDQTSKVQKERYTTRHPARAIDGAIGEEFAWEGLHGDSKWWMVEFTDLYYIDRIDIVWGSHQHLYEIQAPVNGDKWTTVVPTGLTDNREGSQAESSLEIAPVWARFLRINILKTSAPRTHLYQATLQEVLVFESLDTPADGPVGVHTADEPLANTEFEKNLDSWRIYCPDEVISTIKKRGIVEWSPDHGGSAKAVVSGQPSSIKMQQRFAMFLPKGTTVGIEVQDVSSDVSSWRASIGGMDEDEFRFEETRGKDFIALKTSRDFHPGTSLTLHFTVWPGTATFFVKRVSVILPPK